MSPLEQKIEQDLKTALLAGDSLVVNTLRVLKSEILYFKVASGNRDKPIQDDALIGLLQREVKKRQESAGLYQKGGNQEKAGVELAEKDILATYLPQQMTEAELLMIIDDAIKELGESSQGSLGVVIARVKQRVVGRADGALIASLVKDRIGQ